MTVLTKEVCGCCQASVSVGQAIAECTECKCVIHHKCLNMSKLTHLKHDIYCSSCDHLATARYSPFKLDYENNELDVDDVIFNFTQKLETCKAHKVDSFNNSYSNLISEHMSILFQNIDGNKSNFDALAVSLQRFTKKFPIIALVETNVCQEMSSMYQLSEYTPKYQHSAQA